MVVIKGQIRSMLEIHSIDTSFRKKLLYISVESLKGLHVSMVMIEDEEEQRQR